MSPITLAAASPDAPRGHDATAASACQGPAACLSSIAAGHAGAWDALAAQLGPRMRHLARRLLGDDALADDALQEALLSIRTHAGAFRCRADATDSADDQATRWALRIAANAARMIRRTENRQHARATRAAASLPTVQPESAEDPVEIADAVRGAIDALPERERAAVLLRVVAQLPFEQVARELRCPLGSAKTWVHRGVDRLRARIARERGRALAVPAEIGGLLSRPAATARAAAAGALLAAGHAATAPGALQALLPAPLATGALSAGLSAMIAKGAIAAAIATAIAGGAVALVLHQERHGNAASSKAASQAAEASMEAATRTGTAPASGVTAARPHAAHDPPRDHASRHADLASALDGELHLEFSETDFPDVLEFLAIVTKVPFRLDASVPPGTVDPITLSVDRITLRQVLDTLARLGDLAWRQADGGIVFYRAASPAAAPPGLVAPTSHG